MGLRERTFRRPRGVLGHVGGWIMAHTNRATVEWVLDLLRVGSQARILEVGFGPGVGLELAGRRLTDGLAAGVDPSPKMVEMARQRNAAGTGQGTVLPVRGAAERLPFPPAAFQAALAVNTVPLWADPDAGLAEIHRVLEPGGSVALAFTPRFADSADGLADRLTRVGFQRARRIEAEEGVCVFANRLETGKPA